MPVEEQKIPEWLERPVTQPSVEVENTRMRRQERMELRGTGSIE